MNFILVLSANCFKRSKHGLTISPPKKTLQGKRHSPVSDPKVIEIKTAFQQSLWGFSRECVACFYKTTKSRLMLVNRSNLLYSCSSHNLARFRHLTVHISGIKFEFSPTQINLDRLTWFRRRPLLAFIPTELKPFGEWITASPQSLFPAGQAWRMAEPIQFN